MVAIEIKPIEKQQFEKKECIFVCFLQKFVKVGAMRMEPIGAA